MAEQIVNEFTVNRPIDEAWPIICDVERIAPCLPGAELEEIEGDVYRGKVKVKLGAVSAQFKGEAQFVERDDAAHQARLKAKGRDTGGRGIMGDVSKKLMDQFATNLNRMLDEQGDVSASQPGPAAASSSVPGDGEGDGEFAGATTTEPAPTVRKINGPAAEPVDLAGVAGPAVVKRVLPLVLAVVLIVLILRRRK